jgi:hypothetical protein
MLNYKDQLEIIKPIRVIEDETKRMDCPFCGGKNTFTISLSNGKKVWNCYKAKCATRGSSAGKMSTSTIIRRLDGNKDTIIKKTRNPLPDHLSDPLLHKDAYEYLKKNNCLKALLENRIYIRYSVKDDRILFFNKEKTGATGRSLHNQNPKWKVFGEIDTLMTVGDGKKVVVVEDIASACAASNVQNLKGCALLGTNVSLQQRLQLFQYDELIVALDKDASRKGLKIKKLFQNQVKTRLVFLEDDLKNLCDKKIMERLL